MYHLMDSVPKIRVQLEPAVSRIVGIQQDAFIDQTTIHQSAINCGYVYVVTTVPKALDVSTPSKTVVALIKLQTINHSIMNNKSDGHTLRYNKI